MFEPRLAAEAWFTYAESSPFMQPIDDMLHRLMIIDRWIIEYPDWALDVLCEYIDHKAGWQTKDLPPPKYQNDIRIVK